jgi:myo-inositol-hexaphosphate 3-phosphohydrolase
MDTFSPKQTNSKKLQGFNFYKEDKKQQDFNNFVEKEDGSFKKSEHKQTPIR